MLVFSKVGMIWQQSQSVFWWYDAKGVLRLHQASLLYSNTSTIKISLQHIHFETQTIQCQIQIGMVMTLKWILFYNVKINNLEMLMLQKTVMHFSSVNRSLYLYTFVKIQAVLYEATQTREVVIKLKVKQLDSLPMIYGCTQLTRFVQYVFLIVSFLSKVEKALIFPIYYYLYATIQLK